MNLLMRAVTPVTMPYHTSHHNARRMKVDGVSLSLVVFKVLSNPNVVNVYLLINANNFFFFILSK